MVPKHRRSEPSLASVGAPVNTVDWPEPDGYGPYANTAGSAALHARVGPAGNGYPASDGYNGYNGYNGRAVEPGWAAPSDGYPWQEWQEPQDWGPAPALYPDHPSAPVPRVQLSGDHPSRPMPIPRGYGAPDLPRRQAAAPARAWSPQPAPDADYRNGNRWLHAVPDNPPAADYADYADYAPYPGQPVTDLAGPDWRETTGWQETTYYRHETGPIPAAGPFQNGRHQGGDSLWNAGQVLTAANGQAAQIAREAEDYATSIREAAEREAAAIAQQAAGQADTLTQQATSHAAAIREAAEREAAELRARIESMSGDLGRLAAFVTENLTAPAMPAIAPPLPDAMPALPQMTPVLPETVDPGPDTRPAKPHARPIAPGTGPDTRHAEPETTRRVRPDTSPGTRPTPTRPGTGRAMPDTTKRVRPDTGPGHRPTGPGAKPTGPRTAPAGPGAKPTGPRTAPASKADGRNRQQRAARIVTAGTAALLSVAAIGAITMTGIHGFSFFVFRESGQGETPGTFTDADFLAGQKECPGPKVCPAPKHRATTTGKHHKTTSQTSSASN